MIDYEKLRERRVSGLNANILVVDDTHANLRLLTELLSQNGYTVRPVPSGNLAISSALAAPPDLILLDIMMPEISGYDVCQRLKADVSTQAIPIIFISALHDVFDKIKAFSVGGVDYITKPFHPDEVLARVETHLMIRKLQAQLQANNSRLQDEIVERQHAQEALAELNADLEQHVARRTQQLEVTNRELQGTLETLKKTQAQLIQAEKMTLLISLVAGVAHEINTPVSMGLTAASHLDQKTQELEHLIATDALKRSDLDAYVKVAHEANRIILRNMQLASERIQGFKSIAVDQASGERRRFQMKTYLEDVLLSLRPKLKKVPHTITIVCPSDLEIDSYPGAFSQIFGDLIINSLEHGFEHKEQGEIHITVTTQPENMLLISYRDNGKGMDEEQCARIFDAFFTTKRQQGGSGLGMNVVYNLVTRKLQGQIECESVLGVLTEFRMHLPLTTGQTLVHP